MFLIIEDHKGMDMNTKYLDVFFVWKISHGNLRTNLRTILRTILPPFIYAFFVIRCCCLGFVVCVLNKASFSILLNN